MIALYCILGILAAFILFTVIRTAIVKKPTVTKSDYLPHQVDKQTVAAHLSEAVSIPTVTLKNNDEDGSVFFEYQAFLERTYPVFMSKATKTLVNKYSVIYALPGSDKDLLPIAVLAHQDVVPATPEGWEAEPFGGEIKDGFVYGRGSQDMKSQMICGLEAIETLLKEGYEPKRGIYFCYGHDEELRGTEGAQHIAKYLSEKGVRFELVIDEGGTVLDGKILGIDNKIALIGTCEKGYADILMQVNKDGGHASSPTRRTAVGILSEKIYKLESHPRALHWNTPVKQMLSKLAPYMNPLFKYFFVNRDIFSPLLKFVFSVASPFTNTIVRTTIAPTQAEGADTPNTLPAAAKANLNCRINIGDSCENTRAYIQRVVGKKVKVTLDKGWHDPTAVSRIDSDGYKALERTISEVFDGFIVAPYPFIAASDAKYYYDLSDCVYRFTPFEKTVEDGKRIHGLNERQSVDSLEGGTKFFIRLFQNICA